MTSKQMAQKVRMEQWAQVMRTRMESGQSVRTWCTKNRVNEKTFYYWQRKLRNVACEQMAKREGNTPRTGLVPAGWTQVEAKAPPENSLTIEIGSIRIRAGHNTDMGLLGKVCQALVMQC